MIRKFELDEADIKNAIRDFLLAKQEIEDSDTVQTIFSHCVGDRPGERSSVSAHAIITSSKT